jgi:hypothetical protein
MMTNKKLKAISLRQKGLSVRDISHRLNAARGSVSTWVKDVVLSNEQKLRLKYYCHSPEVVERRRQSRLKNEEIKRKKIIDTAAGLVPVLTKENLFVLGVGLYWAEGGKSNRGMARVSNSDPAMIKIVMRFFREICHVPENRFRGHIHIHSQSAVKAAEKFWSDITGVPPNQFYKTYSIKSKASKNKRLTLPYGTLDIGVCDTRLQLTILGWIEGLKKNAV